MKQERSTSYNYSEHNGSAEQHWSLSSSAALKVLIADLEAAVARFFDRNRRTPLAVFKMVVFDNPFTFWPNFIYTFLVSALTFFVFVVSSDGWYLAESLLFFLVICLNCFFVVSDSIYAHEEFARKVQHLIAYFKTLDSSKLDTADFRNIEFFPSSSVSRVVRDDQIVVVPSVVVVRGDVLALSHGERLPCSATFLADFVLPLPNSRGRPSATESVDSGLKASDLLSDRTSIVAYPNTLFYKLNETPIVVRIEEHLLSDAKKQRLPPPILGLIYAVRRWQFFVVVPATFGFAVIFVALMSFAHGYTTIKSVICDLFPFIIHSLFAVSIPLLPTMLTLLRVHGNALIVDESKRLLSTRNERADSGADEAYEHVEVIRPIDLFTQSKLDVFLDVLFGRLPESLPRNGNVLFGFANLNYLCAIDKEGILSCPRPVLQKLLLFSSAQTATSQQSTSSSHMPRNVSFGTFMSSDTVSSAQGKHCRLETLHAITKMQNGILHLDFDEKQWLRHMGVLKAIGLNLVVTSSQVYSERCRSFLNYLNSPFFRSVVDSPTTLTPPITSLNPTATASMAHTDVVNMHTFIPLTERIGFRTEQTLSNYKVEEFVGIYSAAFQLPLRQAFATVCRDVASSSVANSLQLFCQGNPDLILSMCSDFWDGNDLHPFTPGIRARVRDFCNRSSQTGHCVALSYSPLSQAVRPFNDGACLRFVPRTEFPTSVTASPLLTTSAHTLCPRWSDVIEDGNQIFIGVAVLSSQPLMPVIQVVQNLKAACCRFVYFSRENELTSRAFAEKLGLEANWNCFISLAETKDQAAANSNQPIGSCQQEHGISDEDTAQLLPKSSTVIPSTSCTATALPRQPSVDEESENRSQLTDGWRPKRQRQVSTTSGAGVVTIKTSSSAPNLSLFCVGENGDAVETGTVTPSGAPFGESSNDGDGDSSDGMSSHASSDLIGIIENHAQLPRGIKEVRPHIAQCDNVPLLVSLFTDCSRSSTNDMMSIMAENNGVVCSLGSSLAGDNFLSFARTDCAISVLPLTPVAPSHFETANDGSISVITASHSLPSSEALQKQFAAVLNAGLQQQSRDMYLDIAGRLISMPCSLTIRANRVCYLLQMLAQCRHYVLSMKQVFFYTSFAYGTLVFSHLAHLATDRPLPVSPLQFMWLTLFAIPLLASSLITAPIDPDILTQPPHRARVTSLTVAATTCYFLATFLPAVPFCLGLTILFDYLMWTSFAGQPVPIVCPNEEATVAQNNSSHIVFPVEYRFIPPWWRTPESLTSSCQVKEEFAENFNVLSSELSSLFLGSYLLLLATGFVFPLAPMWRQNPLKKTRWFCILLIALIVGTVLLALSHIFITTFPTTPSFRHVSPVSWVLAFALPLVIALPTHELFKLRRTRKIIRQLKRIRLEFNTRLGLNSPF